MRPRISIRGSVRPSVRMSVRPYVRMSVRPSVRNAFSKTVGNELIFNNRPSWEIARPSLVTLAPPPSCHTTTTTNMPTADHWGCIVGLLALFAWHEEFTSYYSEFQNQWTSDMYIATYNLKTGVMQNICFLCHPAFMPCWPSCSSHQELSIDVPYLVFWIKYKN